MTPRRAAEIEYAAALAACADAYAHGYSAARIAEAERRFVRARRALESVPPEEIREVLSQRGPRVALAANDGGEPERTSHASQVGDRVVSHEFTERPSRRVGG